MQKNVFFFLNNPSCFLVRDVQIHATMKTIFLSFFQDGGSLDLILKKAGRIPEPILGKISVAVSMRVQLGLVISQVN